VFFIIGPFTHIDRLGDGYSLTIVFAGIGALSCALEEFEPGTGKDVSAPSKEQTQPLFKESGNEFAYYLPHITLLWTRLS